VKPETKEKIKKIIQVTIWCLLVTGLFVSVGFVEKQQNAILCKNLIININEDDEIYFVQKDDIKQLLLDRKDSIINQPVSSIDIPNIENVLNSHAAISKAEVYMTVNGELKIDIIQRKPLIRIINANNESYYLDTAGKLMPLSENYTSKVLVANGNIHEPYAKRYMYSVNDILENPDVIDKTILDDLYALANYIKKNEFWQSQIQQVYVNENNELELIPRVGEHTIVLGNSDNMDEKFKKLLIFYTEGMNKTGLWNKYSTVDLKYKNQIVCTKK
jgi:cell division protein FtsQ